MIRRLSLEPISESRCETAAFHRLNRLVRVAEDYEALGYTLTSEPNVVSFRTRLSDFDIGEMLKIQFKQQETRFISVDELVMPSHVP